MLNQSTAASTKLANLFWYIARYLITGILLGAVLGGSAQNAGDPDAGIPPVPDKLFEEVRRKAGRTSERLLTESVQYLRRIEASEEKLRNKLAKKDSALAVVLFGYVADRYASLQKMLVTSEQAGSRLQMNYIARLDTLQSAFAFLSGAASSGQSSEVQKKLQLAQSSIYELQNRFTQAAEIQKFIEQRKAFLQQQLGKYGHIKEFKRLQKQVYNYQAQVRQYKTVFDDPSKLEAEAINLLSKLPQFRQFFASNSWLAGMFRLPGGGVDSFVDFTGLQSRDAVAQSLVQRFGSPVQVRQLLQQTRGSQPSLDQLKEKIMHRQGGSDEQMPGFTPNTQKTKRFTDRLELGSSFQTVKSNRFFPSTTDLGLSVGYKLNDKSIVGIGSAYRMGWGRDIRNISITHEGIGLRSFVDYKIKGFWLSGGAEVNYRSRFNNIEVLNNYSAWQKSALLGLSRRYQVSKKMKGNMQLLYDLLWKQQVPRTQAVVFRVGYSFK